MSATKRLAKYCIRFIPDSVCRVALRAAALAPPVMKTQFFERACSVISNAAALSNSKEIWSTNLGVSSKLRCRIPVEKQSYVFGQPKNFLPERATMALVTELCRDCTDFLDVGANDGIYTFAVNRHAPRGLRLHWFEPDRNLHDRLRANLSTNSIRALGTHAAVAAERGTAKFLKNLTSDASGSLKNEFASLHKTIAEEVDTVCLSDYFRDHHIHDAIVKVDVEGAGAEVWRGALGVAAEMRYVIMEIIGPETQCGLPGRIISEANFHAYYIKDFNLTVSRDGTYQYMAPFWNWLFCRLDPGLLRARLAGTQFRVIEN